MYMVYDNEDGLVGVYRTYSEANEAYKKCVEFQHNEFADEGWVTGEERVILAKVYKQLRPHDTKEPVMQEDENGDEIESLETYWELKEDTFRKDQ